MTTQEVSQVKARAYRGGRRVLPTLVYRAPAPVTVPAGADPVASWFQWYGWEARPCHA